MLTIETITAAADRIIEAAAAPARVVLFGSYARGTATEESDLDLLVIERDVADKATEYLRLRRAVGGMGVGVDVLVFSEQEALERSQIPGTLPYWALKEGQVLRDQLIG